VAAIGHYRAALETAALPDAPTYHSAASLLIEDGRREEAVALLSEALEVHPEDRALRDLMVRVLSIR
jgi:tetratricopeptide (TPR) repeat protein